MATPHVRWPFFEARHFDLATRFAHWVSVNLTQHEADEGGDGKAARLIFEALGRDGWLRTTAASDGQGTPCKVGWGLPWRESAAAVGR